MRERWLTQTLNVPQKGVGTTLHSGRKDIAYGKMNLFSDTASKHPFWIQLFGL